MEVGSTEPGASSPNDYYVYDIRTNDIFKFKRMNKYILLQTIPYGNLLKLSVEEFDEYFEGMPAPMGPFLVRTR